MATPKDRRSFTNTMPHEVPKLHLNPNQEAKFAGVNPFPSRHLKSRHAVIATVISS